MRKSKNVLRHTILSLGLLSGLTGCSTMSNVMNPFYESPKPVALLGDKNDHALNGERTKVDEARVALETMASYRRTNNPQPVNPVLQPAVVRLMWVPDHLNKSGDLVPSHYYYLKVLSDRWGVSDAFELENQLNGPAGPTDTSNVPYVLGTDKVQ